MKIEMPNIRIMRGEAADLSPGAAKLLLTLIACQDQNTSEIRWSQQALSEITKQTRSSYYRFLKELTQGNWIIKKDKGLKVSLVGQNVSNEIEKVPPVRRNVSNEIEKVPPVRRNVPTAIRPDQIDLDLKSDQIGLREIYLIADFYHLGENEIDQLIEVCKEKSKAGILMIFETMKRKEIRNPIQYLKKSIHNLNGTVTIQKKSPSFFEMFPEMEIRSRWLPEEIKAMTG